MEIYGDDDNKTAIQDQQHKKIHTLVEFLKFLFDVLRCENLLPEN